MAYYISIHTPLTRCDLATYIEIVIIHTFQSTHLSRGATCLIKIQQKQSKFQSTHLSRGATMPKCCFEHSMQISIHTPLTRCDATKLLTNITVMNFNPHTSHEVRPTSSMYSNTLSGISIHTPLTRCDGN